MLDDTGSSIWSDEQIFFNSSSPDDSTGFMPSRPRSKVWAAIEIELGSFAQLPFGWDGDNAAPPATECISDARRYFALLVERNAAPPDRVLPTPSGTIMAEWHDGLSYREAEFVGNDTIEFMSQTNPAAPFEHALEHLPPLERSIQRVRESKSAIWGDAQEDNPRLPNAA